MKHDPLVSVITPSYNQAAYLEQAMRSVLEQGYPALEYLVVDGGSKDGSTAIIKRHSDRLAWWVTEKDRGQADAINKGLRRAKGEIIAWLNSDDLYMPGTVRKAVETFQKHPRAAMVHGDVLAIDGKGDPINLMRYGDWGLRGLMRFQIIGQPAVFMHRSALQKAGFLDLEYHYLLDHQLWLRVAQHGDIAYVPETWAKARYHLQAKNVAHAAEFGAEAYRIVEWMRKQPGLTRIFQEDERKIMAGAHRFNARYLLDGGKNREALCAYKKSLSADAGIALMEWHRMLYAVLSLMGLGPLKKVYYQLRKRNYP
jgi:glycosyltransferase involved in cell wall biosynthesis